MSNLYSRLVNDSYASFYKNVCLLNQEGDLNKFNSFLKKRKSAFKNFEDGYCVFKYTQKYNARYTFDCKNVNRKIDLIFTSFEGASAINLLDFINSVISADASIFVKVDGFVITDDTRKYLFDVTELNILDSIVDDALLKIIRMYFSKLEKIYFKNCQIKSNCDFSTIKSEIKFSCSQIENIRSLNDCTGDIILERTPIIKITPTTIKTKKLQIIRFLNSNSDLKKLFFICNFPELIEFGIGTKVESYKFSFEDSLNYLPYSAPNLEKIEINGKVKTLDFLTKFKHLIDISVLSIYDDFGMMSPGITDFKEKKKILERNKEEYEIVKILNPYKDDKHIIGNLEVHRILDLCNFLSLIDYSKKDLERFKNKDLIKLLLNKKIDEEVKYYYECYFDKLKLRKQIDELHNTFKQEDMYKIYSNILYFYNSLDFFKKDKRILLSKNFMYSSNGIPIIFKGSKRPIRTKREAEDKSKRMIISNFNLCDYNRNSFIDFLKNYNFKNNISVGAFIDCINEECSYIVSGEDFLQFGESGKKLYYLFEKYERLKNRCDDLIKKQKKYIMLTERLIKENYNLFTPSEKAYLCKHKKDFEIHPDLSDYSLADIYSMLVIDEYKVLDSINEKTNGLYLKYYNYIKLFYELYSMTNNPYDEVLIEPQIIKQLRM